MKKNSGQAMAEYVVALFLCALVAYGVFSLYQRAYRTHYNRVVNARTSSYMP